MSRLSVHGENHSISRIGWLRAAVLGANDGIVSTASLIVGVAAASPDRTAVIVAGVAGLVAGVAGLVAGAMSMATGDKPLDGFTPQPRRGRLRLNEWPAA